MRVLHSVQVFLNLSENWIYPQIVSVRGVQGRVMCSSVRYPGSFPLGETRLIVYPPPWDRALGIPRLLNALARRLGVEGAISRFRVRLWRPQILHAHHGTQGWESIRLKKRLKIPLVTSFYGYDAWRLPRMDPAWKHRYDQLFDTGEVFLVEGPAMRSRLCELGCPPKKVRIQRLGVDLSSLPFTKRCFSNGLKIAMVGRFVEKKGLIDGLRACALARRLGARLTVTIIGDTSADDADGLRLKGELSNIASGAELSGRVDFAGFLPLDQMRTLLRDHNVFLCPSKHAVDGDAEGGSPVVLTEAMAMGLLCIGTRHCDIPEVILDGKTGFLCDEGDTAGLAELLSKIEHTTIEQHEMIRVARQHVEENFSLETQMGKLRSLYETLQTMPA
jgi:colanic acid/amylovoran biosynthesis glycosyltransferase